MRESSRPRHLPDLERLSVLTATISLAYALAHFINLPGRDIAIQILGVYLPVQISVQSLVTLLVASLTATGTDWLLRDHPALGNKRTMQHTLLPALTALVVGLPLFQLPFNSLWWIGFGLSAALLVLVLIAEYIAVDPNDERQPAAAVVLTALSFALYLILAASLRFSGTRLFLELPALTFTAALVSLRALNLRLYGQWTFIEAGIVALITAQIAAALHYWPLPPVSFGLAVLGPAYALTSLIGNLAEREISRQAIVEPLVVLIVIWTVALWIR